MNKDSNIYIFGYAVIMVTVVAVLLTSVSMALKPRQDKNIKNDKIMAILSSIGVESTAENAEEIYNKKIVKELLIDSDGNIISVYENGELTKGDNRAFEVVLKSELKKERKQGNGRFPIYIANHNGKTLYITPVHGNGLWAAIWGNIAFEEDFNTVFGANFDHKSETPGLGAEISSGPLFSDQFKGKKIFNETGEFESIKVIKGGVDSQSQIPEKHGVDGISGGTLTSDGVTNMLQDCLVNYVDYIKNNK